MINTETNFTNIYHPARKKLGLSMEEYAIADMIHQLSNKPKYPWCIIGKQSIANALGLSTKKIFRYIEKLISMNILEKSEQNKRHLRATKLWFDTVIIRGKDAEKVDNLSSLSNNKVDKTSSCIPSKLDNLSQKPKKVDNLSTNSNINNNINNNNTPPDKPVYVPVKGLHHACVKVFKDMYFQKTKLPFPYKYGQVDDKLIKQLLILMNIQKVEEFQAIMQVAINHPFWGGQKLNPTVLWTHINEFIPGGKDVHKNNFSQGSGNSKPIANSKWPRSRTYEELP